MATEACLARISIVLLWLETKWHLRLVCRILLSCNVAKMVALMSLAIFATAMTSLLKSIWRGAKPTSRQHMMNKCSWLCVAVAERSKDSLLLMGLRQVWAGRQDWSKCPLVCHHPDGAVRHLLPNSKCNTASKVRHLLACLPVGLTFPLGTACLPLPSRVNHSDRLKVLGPLLSANIPATPVCQ